MVIRLFRLAFLLLTLVTTEIGPSATFANEVGWQPVSVVALDANDLDAARGQALAVLKDFVVSDNPNLATIDKVYVMVRGYGRIRTNMALSAREIKRLKEARAALMVPSRHAGLALRSDLIDLRRRFRAPPSETASQQQLMKDFLEAGGARVVSDTVSEAIYTHNDLSLDNFIALDTFMQSDTGGYFLDQRMVSFNLALDGTFPLWDRLSLRISQDQDLSISGLLESVNHSPVGSISLALVPIHLFGLTPTLLSHVSFSTMPADLRFSLPPDLKLPTGFLVVRDLCVTCLDRGAGPALPLPLGAWTSLLLHDVPEIAGASPRMAVVGVSYETVPVDWKN